MSTKELHGGQVLFIGDHHPFVIAAMRTGILPLLRDTVAELLQIMPRPARLFS